MFSHRSVLLLLVSSVCGWQYKASLTGLQRRDLKRRSLKNEEVSLPGLLLERWQTVNTTLSEVTRSETYRQLKAVISEWSGNLPVNDLTKAILYNARLGEGAPSVSSLSEAEAVKDYEAILAYETDATYIKSPAARAAQLASAAYANEDNATAFASLGASMVTYGRALDLVPYYIVDSVNGTRLERHVVIRGFDASDVTIDRFELVSRILSAAPTPLRRQKQKILKNTTKRELPFISSAVIGARIDPKEDNSIVLAHQGLLALAEAIYADIYHIHLEGLAPNHHLIICGHSVGGSLSSLLAALIAIRSPKKILPKLNGVYTFAALPCLKQSSNKHHGTLNPQLLGLSPHLVSGFIQPLDPLVRWYSESDPCYPLVDDLAPDGVTLFASGPARVLRPLTRAVLQAADEWPAVRDIYREQANQSYQALGQQFIILPDPDRYVADRLVNLFLDVPIPTALIKIPDHQDAANFLAKYFPLDEFSISLVPAAIRSFIHHFHPAYSGPLLTLRNASKVSRSAALKEQRAEAKLLISETENFDASSSKANALGIEDPIFTRLLEDPLARLIYKLATRNPAPGYQQRDGQNSLDATTLLSSSSLKNSSSNSTGSLSTAPSTIDARRRARTRA